MTSFIAQQDRNRTSNRLGEGLTNNVVRAPKMLSHYSYLMEHHALETAHPKPTLEQQFELDQIESG